MSMLRYRKSTLSGENELQSYTTRTSIQSENATLIKKTGVGVPQASRRIWATDYFFTVICLVCFGLGIAVIFSPDLAAALGQVKQLIIIGVLLSIMSICTQRQLKYFLLATECMWNTSSLQNFQSIIEGSFSSAHTSLYLRITILASVILPVLLGIAYKNFTGSFTFTDPVATQGLYGWTGAPGTTALGTVGIALFYNTTTPWWSAPNTTGVYGFNLVVESENRSALLDGPVEDYVRQLQSMLTPGQSLIIGATVNATVCDLVYDLAKQPEKANLPYWFDQPSAEDLNEATAVTDPRAALGEYADAYFTHTPEATVQTTESEANGDFRFGIIIPRNENGWVHNTSFVTTSRWNRTNNETFGSNAQGFYLHRQQYIAEWSVTSTSISLNAARPILNSTQPDLSDYPPVLENNYSLMHVIFARIFMDFDWKWLGDYGTTAKQLVQQKYIHTDTTLVAAMAWARLTSLGGLSNPNFNRTRELQDGIRIYENSGFYILFTPALEESWLLAVVLAVNPIILLATLVVRVLFFGHAPISKDFGLVSVLAGVDKDSLYVLKNAGYSGKLQTSVRVNFSVADEDDSEPAEDPPKGQRRSHRIVLRLEAMKKDADHSKAKNDQVRSNIVYG